MDGALSAVSPDERPLPPAACTALSQTYSDRYQMLHQSAMNFNRYPPYRDGHDGLVTVWVTAVVIIDKIQY